MAEKTLEDALLASGLFNKPCSHPDGCSHLGNIVVAIADAGENHEVMLSNFCVEHILPMAEAMQNVEWHSLIQTNPRLEDSFVQFRCHEDDPVMKWSEVVWVSDPDIPREMWWGCCPTDGVGTEMWEIVGKEETDGNH